jgi:hypothetical protein
VRRAQRAEHLVEDVQRLGDGELALVHEVGVQRLALEVLHDDVLPAVRHLAEAEDVDDAAVADGVDGAGLGQQARHLLGGGGQLGRSTFTATRLPMSGWMPSYTRPMPPTPMRWRSSYSPIFMPMSGSCSSASSIRTLRAGWVGLTVLRGDMGARPLFSARPLKGGREAEQHGAIPRAHLRATGNGQTTGIACARISHRTAPG